ncbi:hypothetical protein ACIQMV_18800 [Streptomyces sp. NPDC091412]|uniref:hypothetical protein n=1 Tax=Streptomyces sp. NPDC091412 TaxID=3366002 RepID=UPI00382EF207
MVRTVVLTLLEAVCLVAALYGVALIYVPAALILGGILGVVAAERKLAARPPAAHRKEPGS